MKIPDQSQILAFSRHVVSYAMGGVTAISMAHLWQNPQDAANAASAINQVGHGFQEIVAGGGTLIALGMGVFAAVKSSPIVQMLMGAAALLHGKATAAGVSVEDQKTIMEATLRLPKVTGVSTNDAAVAATTSPGIVLAPKG
jgi:hypothetical protein